MTRRLSAADVLARRLHGAGSRHAFGMPGGEVPTLVDAPGRAGITFTLVRHDNAGAFVAESVHHASGAPALLVTTVGPGALDAGDVVENAREDRVPMIGATECLDAETAARYTHRLVDQRAVVGAVTKGHFTMAAGAAEVIADRAVALATSGRPGPVHIDPSLNIADAPAEAEPALRRRPSMPVATVGGARLADLVE